MPVDHLSELPGVVLLHEEDGLPGLLLHAGGAGGHAGAAEHAGSDGCKKKPRIFTPLFDDILLVE